MKFFKNIIFGVLIGVSNIIPGLSGGTIAVILNIYDDFINSISNFKNNIKKNSIFLLAIGIGAGFGILLFSNAINYLIDNHYSITNFFFIGVILGSLPLIYSKSRISSFKLSYLFPFIILLIIMLFTSFISLNKESSVIIEKISLSSFLLLIISSIISSACMVIPGISGSFIFLLFGVYSSIISAISNFNIPILFIVAVGCIIGFLGGAKIIHFLLNKYSIYTYWGILGLVFGSIPVIFSNILKNDYIHFDFKLILSVIFMILGALISYLSSNDKFKEFIKNNKINM